MNSQPQQNAQAMVCDLHVNSRHVLAVAQLAGGVHDDGRRMIANAQGALGWLDGSVAGTMRANWRRLGALRLAVGLAQQRFDDALSELTAMLEEGQAGIDLHRAWTEMREAAAACEQLEIAHAKSRIRNRISATVFAASRHAAERARASGVA